MIQKKKQFIKSEANQTHFDLCLGSNESISYVFSSISHLVIILTRQNYKMLLELLITVTCCLLISVGLGVLLKIVRNYRAQQLYRTRVKGIPFLPNSSILLGNAEQICFNKRNWLETDKWLKLGTTVAGFYADKPVAITCDLDFIKTIVIDEPDDHINRIDLDLPVEELKVDSIAFVVDDQWRRLRKLIEPALT